MRSYKRLVNDCHSASEQARSCKLNPSAQMSGKSRLLVLIKQSMCGEEIKAP
jgi:hypothetical protein